MNRAVIGLGSNIDPKENIEKAIEMIKENYTVLAKSHFVSTKPIGNPKQLDFINGAVYIETKEGISELNTHLKTIEKKLGRVSTNGKFDPRPIDLDVVVFNSNVIDNDFYTRDFVKKSALELIPDLVY